MNLTDFHAKYFAHELTKRCASDSVEKLAAVLADAQVDLNPHQIEAALFAFRSPFSKGAILADEVGLGKTIEAGLLLSQKWAERKRRLLVIVPANLRKQWSQELADKFFLPSTILESRSFNDSIRAGNLNPFQQDTVVLCSYQFARTKEPYLCQTSWNLVVIDEAHRLRNVYKNTGKIAASIKQAIAPFPKVLLTATPLQNSLLELYGLVSIVDDFAFGDLKSYRTRFTRLGNDSDFSELKERLKPLCKRTLRRQVLEYVKFTNRHALVQEFVPSEAEQRLYDLVSGYLQRPALYALPASQRQLMTLILRKLLASSTYAISGTLDGLVQRLGAAAAAAATVDTPPDELPEDLEGLDELADEWEGDEDGPSQPERDRLTPKQLAELRQEMAHLRKKITILEPLINKGGWLICTRLTLSALETEDLLVFAGLSDDGTVLDDVQCRRLFDLPGSQGTYRDMPANIMATLAESIMVRQQEILEGITARNGRWFDTEMDKLDRWAEDCRTSLKAELAEMDEALKEAKKAARLAPTLPEKLERQRAARTLEAKREEAWRAYDQAGREIDRQKDALLDEISRRLEQHIEQEQPFAVRWQLV